MRPCHPMADLPAPIRDGWRRRWPSAPAQSRYIDMYEQRIEEISKAGTNLWSKVGTIFSTDAQTAMGVYDVNGMVLFRQELNSLKERIRQKGRSVTK